MSKTHVPLDQVRDNPHQPRVEIGDIEGLAETILQHGLRQLPEARLVVDGTQPSYSSYAYAQDQTWYLEEDEMAVVELASGHRRVEAVRQLNLDDTVTDGDLRDVGLTPGYVPVDLQRLSDEEMLDLLTIENAQRQSLSPFEEARLIGEMVDAGRDAPQIAERFGKSPSWVSNRKRLTTLPVYVQEHVHDGKISVRQAQPLVTAFAVKEEHPDLVQQVNVGLKPGTMVGKAMRGHLTSDDIRDRTDELVDVVERVEKQMDETDEPKELVELPNEWEWTDSDWPEESLYRAVRSWGMAKGNPVRSVVVGRTAEEAIEEAWEHENAISWSSLKQTLAGTGKPSLPEGWVWTITHVDRDGEPSLRPTRYDGEPIVPKGWSREAKGQDIYEKAQDAIRLHKVNKNDSDTSTETNEPRRDNQEDPSDSVSDTGARASEDLRAGDGGSGAPDPSGEGDAEANEEERPETEGAPDQHVSGDDAPSDPNAGHPVHLPMVIDAVEADGHDWKLRSFDEGHYQGTVQNGRTGHMAEGTTPAEALQSAWHSARDVPADQIGSVNESDVDRLLSADGVEMWDDQAAEEASIASLLVAHRVAGERQETWRTTLIAEAVEERVGRVDRDDVPEDVLEEVQVEVERRLKPVEA